MHEEHRDRMRKRFLRDGIDKFESHEVLEMLLYGVIPRRNTNDIAHNLMDHFGTLSNVIDASYAELLKVKGVGPIVAVFINLMSGLIHRYLVDQETPSDNNPLSLKEIEDIFISKFFNIKDEHLAVMLLDKDNRFLACDVLRKGSFDAVSVNAREIFDYASRYNSNKVIIAHNHPSGIAMPSAEDLKFTMELRRVLHFLNIYLFDHIIVGSNDCFSFEQFNLFRELEKEQVEKEKRAQEIIDADEKRKIRERKERQEKRAAAKKKKEVEKKVTEKTNTIKSATKSTAKKTTNKKAGTSKSKTVSGDKPKTSRTSRSKTISDDINAETKESTTRKKSTSKS